MVLMFPFSYGFSLLCVVGSLLAVSSSHWLGVWLGLEINLLGFIPLMVQGFEGGQGVESAVKYFIVQALGSSFILLGGFSLGDYLFSWFFGGCGTAFMLFCFFGLCLKLGVAPFHWWVPSVMGGLSWFCCGVLLTWQKFGPFFILGGFSYNFYFLLLIFGLFSSIIGGVLGIGQVQIRLLMAYSSIGHWGWLLSLLSASFFSSIFYYSFYFVLSGGLFYFFYIAGLGRVSQITSAQICFIFVGLLSMGGLPPLSGFVMKMIGIQGMVTKSGVFWLGGLILGSLLSLFYYLNFVFVLILATDIGWGGSAKFYSSVSVSIFVVLVVLGLPFYEIFLCLA
uniref:NADH-ubiquinone oxidoreductase chain 2 n=1 Tax=Kulikovia alborostrata TaxID=187796 RepID=I6MR61_9BILA|nr:NADH dehydrogenase subunit 2 [Kulikovia alborostrata]AEM23539.1 NADH dehydrogenase subunit 2 [Kulikovia alborostrata]